MSDMLAVSKLVDAIRQDVRMRALFEAEPATKVTEQGFEDIELPLADLSTAGAGGIPLKAGGYGAVFLRRGSTAGALLQLKGTGIQKRPFAPGDSFRGWFTSGDISACLAPGSVTTGTAVLRVFLSPQVWFWEAQIDVPVEPVALLGSITGDGTITYSTIAEDVAPTSLSGLSGAFNVSGWKRILVLIDTLSNGANATSFELNPFFKPGSYTTGTMFDQGGTALIPVADSNPSGGRYRVVFIDLDGSPGWLYLGVRNLLAAARTGLDMLVLGIM